MSNVPAANLSTQDKATLACTYAALLLHDEGIDITDKKISAIIKVAGLKVESFWPTLFAKTLADRNVADLLVAQGGSSAPSQGQSSAAPADNAASKPAAEAKKEVKKEEPSNLQILLFFPPPSFPEFRAENSERGKSSVFPPPPLLFASRAK